MILKKVIRFAFLLIAAILVVTAVAFSAALYYKNDILTALKTELDKRINGKIDVSEIKVNFFQHFPNLSLSLVGIKVSDSLYHFHKKHLLTAEKISFSISLYGLFYKRVEVSEVNIRNGTINLLRDSSNYFNGNIFKKNVSNKKETFNNLSVDFS